jgi:hypothetical protein
MAAMAAERIPIGTQLEISKLIQMDDGEDEELGWVYHADCALQHAATVVLRRLGLPGVLSELQLEIMRLLESLIMCGITWGSNTRELSYIRHQYYNLQLTESFCEG